MKRMRRAAVILMTLCLIFGIVALSAFADTSAPGTQQNPDDANAKYFSGTRSYLLNTTLEAGDEDGYYYTFTTEEAGVLYIENSATMAYQIVIRCDGMEYKAYEDGVNTNSLSTYRLPKGKTVIIHLYALADDAGNIPGGTIYANLLVAEGDDYETVPLKSEGYKAYVASGDAVCYQDATRSAAYSGQGLVVTGEADVISQTVIHVNGVDYSDENGDGKIQLTVPGGFTSRYPIRIENHSAYDGVYDLTITDPVQEFVYENGTRHKLDYHAEVAPCHMDGMMEYWYCGICDVYYADMDAKVVINAQNLTIPATATLQHFEAVVPGCHYLGNVEYWYCADCEGYWTDAQAREPIANSHSVILPATGGEVTHFEAIEPGCHFDGQLEHWICYECEQVWTDEALTQLSNTKNVILPATGGQIVHVEAKEPTCAEDGNLEHWYCAECQQAWLDQALTELTEPEHVVKPAAHIQLTHVAAVAPGVHSDGNLEYWLCQICQGHWTDEALSQAVSSEDVILSATCGGEIIFVEAAEATQTREGNLAHWHCPQCGGYWLDEARTQITDAQSVRVPVKAPPATVPTEPTAPPTEPVPTETKPAPTEPSVSGTPEPTPATPNLLPLWIGLAIAVVGAACVFVLKKKK